MNKIDKFPVVTGGEENDSFERKNNVEYPGLLNEVESGEVSMFESMMQRLNLGMLDIKKDSVRLLTAFAIFMGSTTAYAQGVAEQQETSIKTDEEISFKMPADDSPTDTYSSSLKRLIEKIELTVGGRVENVEEYETTVEDVPVLDIVFVSTFYRDENGEPITTHDMRLGENISDAGKIYFNTLKDSSNAEDYFEKLKIAGQDLSNIEKINIVQLLGRDLDQNYSYDMLENNKHVKISDDQTFQVMKNYVTNPDKAWQEVELGICGNISTFMSRAAKTLGLEAWLQSGAISSGNSHVWMGTVIENDKGKEIAFIDTSGILVPTGTLNYKDALAIIERHHERVSVFKQYVASEDEYMMKIKSRAHELVLDAANIKPAGDLLAKNLESREYKSDNGLNISVKPDAQQFKFTKDSIGLAFYNFSDVYDNPYQSMEAMQAGQINSVNSGEHASADLDVTVMNINMKDFAADKGNSYVDILGRLAVGLMDKQELTKDEYNNLVLSYGTNLQAAIKYSLQSSDGLRSVAGMVEGAIGARLVYADPNNLEKFYIGAVDTYNVQTNNMEEQKFEVVRSLRNFQIGGDVKVNEATIIGLDATRAENDWGKTHSARIDINTPNYLVGAEYEKQNSDYERFYPDSEKISGEIGIKGGGWEVDLIGFSETQQYASDAKIKNLGGEVKLKFILWP